MNYDDENELTLLNRLLEQLHQADYRVLGSIEINIYKPGSQHVDKVERQYITASPPNPLSKGRGGSRQADGEARGELPEVLRTEEAMALWEKVREAGYVDKNNQPLLSRSQSALLADTMAERLGIKEKWKVFETLWQRKNMYKDYYRALGQKQSLKFQDTLRTLFSVKKSHQP